MQKRGKVQIRRNKNIFIVESYLQRLVSAVYKRERNEAEKRRIIIKLLHFRQADVWNAAA